MSPTNNFPTLVFLFIVKFITYKARGLLKIATVKIVMVHVVCDRNETSSVGSED